MSTVNPIAELIDGSMHLAWPSVIVRAGVLGNSLLPNTELEKSVEAWEGVPITIRHPREDDTYVSVANVPDSVVGFFRNPVLVEDKIKGDILLNVAALAGRGEDGVGVMNRLLKGLPTDVSTSYFYDKQTAVGELNGQQYNYATLNIEPDHVAILPNETGNCSWSDGCGIPRVNSVEEKQFMICDFTTNSEQGEETMEDEQKVDVQEDEIVDETEVQPEQEVNEETIIEDDNSQDLSFSEFLNALGGADVVKTALRSLIEQEREETEELVTNVAKSTGIDVDELRKLNKNALRRLINNKRERYSGVEGGMRANSTETTNKEDDWVPYTGVTEDKE